MKRGLILFVIILLVAVTPVLGLGRPSNCFDTAYQVHPGYNENQATWDRYTAETDGVCQTQYGRGVPSSECEHVVQVSRAGNPYYLCWYNNVERSGPTPTLFSEPFVYNGKEYYVVTSEDSTRDTGDEVCAQVGKRCIGYTAEENNVCRHFHPSAILSASMDGDISTVYCEGPPQGGACAYRFNNCHTCPECTAGVDCSTPIGGLYREMYVECGEDVSPLSGFLSLITGFFTRLFSGLFSFLNLNRTITTTTTVVIGPYPDRWACEFFQIPWPTSNKKHVSCPYETPGAAINEADDGFCRIVMNSPHAVAEVCDENGLIVCSHPCPPNPPHIIPSRCAFDSDRPRGNQAPPLNWCPPTTTIPIPSGAGRPTDCFDTAYQAHPGYNENQATWDRYTAETDGVCQSTYGRGVPSGCEYIVQLSRAGNPYYLCWYNNP
jgi:hypothetical protein